MRPLSRVVCWNCRIGNKQLFCVRDESGAKTPDYICVDCKLLGKYEPPIGNMSKMFFPTEEQLQALKETQQADQSTQKVIAVEGDPVVVQNNGESLPQL